MQIRHTFFTMFLLASSLAASGQQFASGPEPQQGTMTGTVLDSDGGLIPGATVTIDGPEPRDHYVTTSSDSGYFTVTGLRPAVSLSVSVSANGFAAWNSPPIVLSPGQQWDLSEIKLKISLVETSVSAITQEELATEQVHVAEQQRVFGIIPNFYIAYDKNTVPLTTRLKFELAFKASTDAATIGAAGFLAGINQAANRPNYVQGAKGYGQRFGAAYADGASGIIVGGAILPSLLHQDPRYFYQGTGTTRSRMLHALSSPIRAKGDNGKWQFNYSSIGGDLVSGALSNVYYPPSNRGPSLVFTTALTTTAGRMVNALAQEFILSKFTSRPKTAPAGE
jgi:hypothetical protein